MVSDSSNLIYALCNIIYVLKLISGEGSQLSIEMFENLDKDFNEDANQILLSDQNWVPLAGIQR